MCCQSGVISSMPLGVITGSDADDEARYFLKLLSLCKVPRTPEVTETIDTCVPNNPIEGVLFQVDLDSCLRNCLDNVAVVVLVS